MTVSSQSFAHGLRDLGVEVATGVPCSALSAFVSHNASAACWPYIGAASEGEAVAIAAGSWLGGRFPLVLMQNSGLGNAVNPLTSLCATFDIPLLLVVSHRGHDPRDAPQHRLMGAITLPLLDLMQIPAFVLPTDGDEALSVAAQAWQIASTSRRPAALVVRKGTFDPVPPPPAPPPKTRRPTVIEGLDVPSRGELPTRHEALLAIDGALRGDDLVLAATGRTSRELSAIRDRPGNFPMVGSMGCASGIGLGVALARPGRRVVVVDGDGALLMKLGTVATIGHCAPPALLHVVLDNGVHETTGGQPTVSSGLSFEHVAAGAGYARVVALSDTAALARLVADFRPGDGPVFATLSIAGGHVPDVPRIPRTPQQVRDAFRAAAAG